MVSAGHNARNDSYAIELFQKSFIATRLSESQDIAPKLLTEIKVCLDTANLRLKLVDKDGLTSNEMKGARLVAHQFLNAITSPSPKDIAGTAIQRGLSKNKSIQSDAIAKVAELLGYSPSMNTALQQFSNHLKSVRHLHFSETLQTNLFDESKKKISITYDGEPYLAHNPKTDTNSCFFHSLGRTREQAIEALQYCLSAFEATNPKFKGVARGIYDQMFEDRKKNSNCINPEKLNTKRKELEEITVTDPTSFDALLTSDSKDASTIEKQLKLREILSSYLDIEWKSSTRMVEYQLPDIEEGVKPSSLVDAFASLYDVGITVLRQKAANSTDFESSYMANTKSEHPPEKNILLLHANTAGQHAANPDHFLRLIPEQVDLVTSIGAK